MRYELLTGSQRCALPIWNKLQSIAMVGDAFAKPMLKVLDENPGRFDMSSLITIVSSGVMWSKEVKQGLIGHIPQVALMDSFGASEGLGFGRSVTTAAGKIGSASGGERVGPVV